jgi:hypothetical protein
MRSLGVFMVFLVWRLPEQGAGQPVPVGEVGRVVGLEGEVV